MMKLVQHRYISVSGMLLRQIHSKNEGELIILSNKNKRRCINCKHLKFDGYKCKKWGQYDFIDDMLIHPTAESCRRNEKLCGESAIFHEEITYIELRNKFLSFLGWQFALPIGGCVLLATIMFQTCQPRARVSYPWIKMD